jgi:membrane dipeptidase
VADHPRNLDDETLLALKASGGVVQVVAYGGHVRVQPAEQREALNALAARLEVSSPVDPGTLPEGLRAEYQNGVREIDAQWPPADLEDFVDHIDHAVALIGIDHVGISSDFGGGGGIVGWTDARETPNVTNELSARGYSEEAIAKLWGGNLLRVWREVERVAEEL